MIRIARTASLVVLLLLAVVTCAVAGDLLVPQLNGNCVMRYSLDGTLYGEVAGGPLYSPTDAVIGPDGRLYATDFHPGAYGGIRVYDGVSLYTGGSYFATGMYLPISLDFGPDGDMFVSVYGQDGIFRYAGPSKANAGTWLGVVASPKTPKCLRFGSDGMLYVASMGRQELWKVNPANGAVTVLAENIVADPEGLEVAPDGTIYVASEMSGILKYSSTGTLLGTYTSSLANRYWGVGLGSDNKLYVSGIHGVMRMNTDGTGQETFLTGQNNPYYLSFYPDAVPEPSSLIALAMGGIGLLGMKIRRRK